MLATEVTNEALVIQPTVNLTATNAEDMRGELERVVSAEQGNVVIDLASVDMIDSKGLSVVLACYQTLSAQGRDLTVVTDNEDLQRLFHIMGLDEHFTVKGS